MGRDSELYCKRCKNRKHCREVCYPVEQLLDAVTREDTPPAWYREFVQGTTGEFFFPPRGWTDKSNSRKVFELIYQDGMTQTQAASIVGMSQQMVSRILARIQGIVDDL